MTALYPRANGQQACVFNTDSRTPVLFLSCRVLCGVVLVLCVCERPVSLLTYSCGATTRIWVTYSARLALCMPWLRTHSRCMYTQYRLHMPQIPCTLPTWAIRVVKRNIPNLDYVWHILWIPVPESKGFTSGTRQMNPGFTESRRWQWIPNPGLPT